MGGETSIQGRLLLDKSLCCLISLFEVKLFSLYVIEQIQLVDSGIENWKINLLFELQLSVLEWDMLCFGSGYGMELHTGGCNVELVVLKMIGIVIV